MSLSVTWTGQQDARATWGVVAEPLVVSVATDAGGESGQAPQLTAVQQRFAGRSRMLEVLPNGPSARTNATLRSFRGPPLRFSPVRIRASVHRGETPVESKTVLLIPRFSRNVAWLAWACAAWPAVIDFELFTALPATRTVEAIKWVATSSIGTLIVASLVSATSFKAFPLVARLLDWRFAVGGLALALALLVGLPAQTTLIVNHTGNEITVKRGEVSVQVGPKDVALWWRDVPHPARLISGAERHLCFDASSLDGAGGCTLLDLNRLEGYTEGLFDLFDRRLRVGCEGGFDAEPERLQELGEQYHDCSTARFETRKLVEGISRFSAAHAPSNAEQHSGCAPRLSPHDESPAFEAEVTFDVGRARKIDPTRPNLYYFVDFEGFDGFRVEMQADGKLIRQSWATLTEPSPGPEHSQAPTDRSQKALRFQAAILATGAQTPLGVQVQLSSGGRPIADLTCGIGASSSRQLLAKKIGIQGNHLAQLIVRSGGATSSWVPASALDTEQAGMCLPTPCGDESSWPRAAGLNGAELKLAEGWSPDATWSLTFPAGAPRQWDVFAGNGDRMGLLTCSSKEDSPDQWVVGPARMDGVGVAEGVSSDQFTWLRAADAAALPGDWFWMCYAADDPPEAVSVSLAGTVRTATNAADQELGQSEQQAKPAERIYTLRKPALRPCNIDRYRPTREARPVSNYRCRQPDVEWMSSAFATDWLRRGCDPAKMQVCEAK